MRSGCVGECFSNGRPVFSRSQCKQPERDQEREQLRRELQYTKNHFASLHLSQDVPDNVSEIEVRMHVEP